KRIDLFAIFVIGLQALFLVWRLIPSALQQSAIAILTQLTGSSDALPSLTLFPYVILWVGVTDWLYRKSSEERFHGTSVHQDVSLRRLAYFGEWLILGLGVVLTLISTLNPITRSLNLLLSTITLIIVTHRRIPIRVSLVYLTHSIGLLTLCSSIDTLLPNLSKPVWAAILLTVMVGEWGVGSGGNSPSSQRLNHPTSQSRGVRSTSVPTRLIAAPIWYRSCWYIGFVLAGLSYILLWDETFTYSFTTPSTPQQWGLLWLLTPLTLTGVASRTGEPRRNEASWWSVLALIMVQFLTFSFPGVRLISLAFATGLMGLNTRYLKELPAALITIGFGLSYVGMLLWDGIPGLPKLSAPDWFLVGAIAISILWLLRRLLIQRPGTLTALYAQASDYWAIALCSIELLILSLHSLASYQEFTDASWQHITASILISSAILYRSWEQPTDAGVYAISWAVEITVAESILLLNGSTLTLAIANIILAILTLFLTDWWLTKPSQTARTHRPKSPSSSLPTPHSPLPISRLNSLEILPLIYALLGIGLRLDYFTPYTGFIILGAALTGVGVGQRHAEWKGISYLGIAGISIAWYELVIYQMLQASGESPADGFTILALVAVAIAIVYRLFAWFWKSRHHTHLLNFTIAEITTIAHFHWGIGSVLILLAAITSIGTTPQLRLASIAISWMLALYALLQGRYPKQRNTKNSDQPHPPIPSSPSLPIPSSSSDSWVYLGLIEVAITGIYARLTWTQLSIIDPWRVIFTCVFAIFIYQIPWWRWRWNVTPWQRYAIVSPLLTVLTIGLKGEIISDINILAIAAFYAWVAHRQSNLRWTYLSVLFIDWAVARWLENQQLTDPLWYPSLIGLSLLYIAQFDPDLRMPQQRQPRHSLRLLGSGIICLVALFSHQETGLIPGIISIIAIFVGLGLRVRAFLFVGTATFLATGFYQLVVLSTRYPFSKGVIGLILGILFISIAANFERRREQILGVLRNWINQFNEWA
ncbi:MAG TPA: DUF2157 domain-containing protein, partial [Cyanobacteria bacterium UBA11148]|nr:DUF2157 domain-containing protein [Cyanobacteria bacterium UBA11148]